MTQEQIIELAKELYFGGVTSLSVRARLEEYWADHALHESPEYRQFADQAARAVQALERLGYRIERGRESYA
jgi:phosphotransacetylase